MRKSIDLKSKKSYSQSPQTGAHDDICDVLAISLSDDEQFFETTVDPAG